MSRVPFYAASVRARLLGQSVAVCLGVSFDFLSGAQYVWQGFGAIDAGGHRWDGLGQLGAIADFEIGPAAPTQPVEMTLSGCDPILAATVAAQRTEVAGRRCRIWEFHFAADWQLLDQPYCLRTLVMDRMVPDFDQARGTAAVKLHAEPLTSTKHRPAYAYLSHADQQARWPGDTALQRTSRSKHTVTWG